MKHQGKIVIIIMFQTPHTLLNVSYPGNEVPGSKKVIIIIII